MFVKKGFQYVTDANSGKKVRIESHKEFHERLRKTLYYGKYTDGTLPSPTVTDVAVKLINSKTNGKKSLDKCHAARITRRARISPCALMMGILYTERLAHSNPCYLKKVSSSDLFVVSMLVASKYLYDDGEDDDAYNYDWSKAGNYHVSDLNRLEREFLNSIEWKIFVSSKEFFDFVNKIETRVALDQGSERGWYSYLDMRTLLENALFKDLLKKYVTHTGKVILCCALAYTFSVALLFSTPVILNSYLDQQSIVDIERDLALLPAISFLGHIGHLEYALAISVSVRSRQAKDALKLIDVVQNVSVKSNDTQNRTHSGKSCGKCGHSKTDLFYKVKKPLQANRYVAVDRTKCSEERSCINNMVAFNGTAMRNSDNLSFNQVLAFMKFPFNHSWTYREVRFPVWENSYSGILIGFSTSAVTAAAVAA